MAANGWSRMGARIISHLMSGGLAKPPSGKKKDLANRSAYRAVCFYW